MPTDGITVAQQWVKFERSFTSLQCAVRRSFLPCYYQSFAESMFLRQKRQDLLMPELDLFALRKGPQSRITDASFLIVSLICRTNARTSDVLRHTPGLLRLYKRCTLKNPRLRSRCCAMS